jgi:GNAT superfamily N-acetyltransferase
LGLPDLYLKHKAPIAKNVDFEKFLTAAGQLGARSPVLLGFATDLLGNRNMRTRRALASDLSEVLELYRHLNPDMPLLTRDKAQEIWTALLSRQGLDVFVTVVDSIPLATCTLVTAPNLIHGGRPLALIENVVTHRDFRREGYGRACLAAALEAAWHQGCHQVMLLTSRTDPAVFAFYENCGFKAGRKTGFVAKRPRAP